MGACRNALVQERDNRRPDEGAGYDGNMGMLVHRYHSLSDVARRGGRVHRGVVEAARDGGRDVDVRISRTWPEPPAPPPATWRSRLPWAKPPPAAAAVRRFQLARDVEWTDWQRSPVDFGLAGGLRRLEVGQDVLIVETIPIEALLPSAYNLDSVAMAFEPAFRAVYRARPAPELVGDLLDPSRADVALAALRESGRLTAGDLLDRWDGAGVRTLLGGLLHDLPAAEQEQLGREALAWFTAHPAPGRGDRLAELIQARMAYVDRLRGARLELAGRIASCLDPSFEPERHVVYAVEFALERLLASGLVRLTGWGGAVAAVLRAGTASDELKRQIFAALPPDEHPPGLRVEREPRRGRRGKR
jgi:hypothetical protein